MEIRNCTLRLEWSLPMPREIWEAEHYLVARMRRRMFTGRLRWQGVSFLSKTVERRTIDEEEVVETARKMQRLVQ